MNIWSGLFWKDAVERAIVTFAQVLLAMLSVDGLDLLQVDVTATLVAALIGGLLALLKAVAATRIGSTVSPASLVKDDRGL